MNNICFTPDLTNNHVYNLYYKSLIRLMFRKNLPLFVVCIFLTMFTLLGVIIDSPYLETKEIQSLYTSDYFSLFCLAFLITLFGFYSYTLQIKHNKKQILEKMKEQHIAFIFYPTKFLIYRDNNFFAAVEYHSLQNVIILKKYFLLKVNLSKLAVDNTMLLPQMIFDDFAWIFLPRIFFSKENNNSSSPG